jgi:hypothetical protein
MSKPKSARAPIHPSIKIALGYEPNEPDDVMLEDWKARTTRVCKPCWELKYCPYGPLVEQSPTIPPLREGMIDQIQYFKRCLETNTVGSAETLTPKSRRQYEEWISNEQILLKQAGYQLRQRDQLVESSKLETDEEKIEAWIGGSLPPIHIYRASFEYQDADVVEGDFSAAAWAELTQLAAQLKEKYRLALKTGIIDHRSPLEPARAAWFRARVEEFKASEYPENVPETFHDAECNIFGHVCPVFFAAEASTETSTERRRGRYIPFAIKMRVVRRDNHTCQHCGKQLKDDEVEFDHIIPIAKGGSSEEHNIRLTCFDCNRDKSDDYIP